VQLKLLVQLIKVQWTKLGHMPQSKVVLRVDGDVQMITLVGEEGGNSGGSAWGIVCMRTRLMVGVRTNCPAGSCSRLGDTVPKSGLFVLSVHLLQDDILK